MHVESVERVCLFTMFRACDLPRWVFSKALLWFWEGLHALMSVAERCWVEHVGTLCVGQKRGRDGMREGWDGGGMLILVVTVCC